MSDFEDRAQRFYDAIMLALEDMPEEERAARSAEVERYVRATLHASQWQVREKAAQGRAATFALYDEAGEPVAAMSCRLDRDGLGEYVLTDLAREGADGDAGADSPQAAAESRLDEWGLLDSSLHSAQEALTSVVGGIDGIDPANPVLLCDRYLPLSGVHSGNAVAGCVEDAGWEAWPLSGRAPDAPAKERRSGWVCWNAADSRWIVHTHKADNLVVSPWDDMPWDGCVTIPRDVFERANGNIAALTSEARAALGANPACLWANKVVSSGVCVGWY